MSRVVINVATTHPDGNDQYVRWQRRLLESLGPFDVPYIAWRDQLPEGCPPHHAAPYAFKPHAFTEAVRRGCDRVLWCDAPVWARKDPSSVFDLLERTGHAFFRNGYNCGQWCTDAALDKHGLGRDEAMGIPDFTGCCMGLDLRSARSREFLNRWKAAADDGVSFVGDWTNERQQCSADPRCRGHRHDQVIGSIIAHQMGMPLTDPGELFSYWNGGDFPDSVVLVNGRG